MTIAAGFHAKTNPIDTDIDKDVPTTDDGATTPFGHDRAAGDWADDDGQYIDGILEPNPNGEPLPRKGIVFPDLDYTDNAPHVTRLLGRTLVLQPTDAAVPFFPADPHRIGLQIRVSSALPVGVITDGVLVASEKTDVDAGSAGFLVASSNASGSNPASYVMDEHNGAVWISPRSIVGGVNGFAVTVTVLVVTK